LDLSSSLRNPQKPTDESAAPRSSAMSRWSRYDSDEERLPEGMTRVGYDADTQTYTYRDSSGGYWEGEPGCRYGRLSRTSSSPPRPSNSSPASDDTSERSVSWRHEMMPLLNFFVLVGLFLLVVFWFLGRTSSTDPPPSPACRAEATEYTVKDGDTCWGISQQRGLSLERLTDENAALDCGKLKVGQVICLPNT